MNEAPESAAVGTGYSTVAIKDVGPVRLVLLDRLQVRNCLDLVLRRELAAAIREADADPGCRAILLAGNGAVFCAGGDIKTLNADPVAGRHRLALAGDITRAILGCETPLVAAVEGGAWGAGLALAAACDVVVVGRRARLAASFGRFGLVGDTGAFYVLRQRVGAARAKEMLLLNTTLNGDQAVAEGLATYVADDGDARRVARDLALRLAGAGEGANTWTKRIIHQDQQDFESVLEAEIGAQLDLLGGSSFAEGQRAFIEKRDPCWWDDLGAEPVTAQLERTIGGDVQ
ncbi:enoyl-CoA hydratase/isomerase family protein [Leekyejoonella antrihumi]|uniref:Enoyl-CoA hydratase/isomerase family protein n=1 Tax=Leekyejoonella antrihumi TaxID=1660198 RepID=A0A563DY91_9MICO|nr:enoyl-CoA hydratase/isomerase family protein [Leekyejoonella antrihumi]TWP34941.1 enoyl-CoA hydratase/isomerase family protein [Leekyejoonella antrihumi]